MSAAEALVDVVYGVVGGEAVGPLLPLHRLRRQILALERERGGGRGGKGEGVG